MENKVISQKEYLKKYISLGDSDEKKKKKKKKLKTGAKTVKIIDDDIDLKNIRPIKEGEFDILLEGEDAPQIAGIIDERGPVDFTDKRRWKIITENEEGDLTIINRTSSTNKEKISQTDEIDVSQNNSDDLDLSPPRSKYSKNKSADSNSHRKSKDKSKDYDSDLSPPRFRHSKNKHADSSPHRKSKDRDSDLSPPRSRHSKNKHADSSRRFKANDSDSDLSPPRQSKNNDSDLSPPRKSRNNDNDSDLSPPRQSRNYDSDLEPPRKNMKHSTHGKSERNYRSSRNRDSDSDLYESRKNKKSRDSNSSISRRREHRSRKEDSPHSSLHRTDRGQDYYDKNSSRSSRQDVSRSHTNRDKRKEYEDQDHKSRSHSDTRERRKKSRWGEETDNFEGGHAESHSKEGSRMTKTLDGKRAGFQAAKELREELEAHKQRDAELFSKLSNEMSGKGQATIVRDRQTGRKRNLEEEAAKDREQQKKQQEMNEKYAKWGKGLKQVEDREEKLKNDLYEMNKPLARYADDADLDKELREQEREGDPMLQYIKQKQIKEGKRKPEPAQYQGSYAPNRFGIKPGHRWDGVDRSNGYEKKWFETQNAKKARQEEAYKWSTSDM